jgi:16S rRNA (uracil1498-N3)-methyltransferase
MPGHFTFYTTEISNGIARFDEGETGHAIRSLRYKEGDEICFTDGRGKQYQGNITQIGKKDFHVKVISISDGEPFPKLTIYCGILKSTDRMEWMVEKCTELGISALYFLKTQNSERPVIKTEKLLKTAVAALKQSHRSWLPKIGLCNWDELISSRHESKFIAMIPENGKKNEQTVSESDVAVLIGPEGDFTEAEVSTALSAGFKPLALGSGILRTETAAVTAAAWCALQSN